MSKELEGIVDRMRYMARECGTVSAATVRKWAREIERISLKEDRRG